MVSDIMDFAIIVMDVVFDSLVSVKLEEMGETNVDSSQHSVQFGTVDVAEGQSVLVEVTATTAIFGDVIDRFPTRRKLIDRFADSSVDLHVRLGNALPVPAAKVTLNANEFENELLTGSPPPVRRLQDRTSFLRTEATTTAKFFFPSKNLGTGKLPLMFVFDLKSFVDLDTTDARPIFTTIGSTIELGPYVISVHKLDAPPVSFCSNGDCFCIKTF